MTISTTDLLVIINLILTSLVGLLMPLSQGFGFMLKHISRSKCCGGSIEVRQSNINRKKSTPIDKV